MKGIKILCLALILSLPGSLSAQDLQSLLDSQIDLVVAQDGSGDYTTLMDAVYSVAKNKTTRTVIFVKKGTYYEKFEIESGLNKITLIGEDVDSTFIVFDDYSGSGELYEGIMTDRHGDPIGTSTSHTMYIDSDEFILLNVTVINSAGAVGQAVAVNLGGDRTILAHCRILGNQDTFYTWGYGRFFMYDCFIEGNVDFIFGRGVAVFDSCIINTNRSSCQITAASTDAGWKYGYVFQHCNITANRGVSGVTMGRPWRENAQTVFMDSYLDKHIAAAGWTDWDGRSATCYYAEYNNNGPGSGTSSRVSWSHQLTEGEAALYTRDLMFKKDVNPSNFSSDWMPDIHSDPVYQVLKANSDLLFTDSLQNNADLKYIEVDGTPIEDFDAGTKVYYIEIPDTTSVSPVVTTECLAAYASYEVKYPDEWPGNVLIPVTALNGFTQTYQVRFKLVPMDIAMHKTSMDITLLQNPVGDEMSFKLSQIDSDETLNISVLSLNGKLLVSQNVDHPASGQLLSIDTSSLVPGVYVCSLSQGQNFVYEKVVKQ